MNTPEEIKDAVDRRKHRNPFNGSTGQDNEDNELFFNIAQSVLDGDYIHKSKLLTVEEIDEAMRKNNRSNKGASSFYNLSQAVFKAQEEKGGRG